VIYRKFTQTHTRKFVFKNITAKNKTALIIKFAVQPILEKFPAHSDFCA